MKKVILSLAVISTLLFSCSNDDSDIVVEVPDTYTFTRDGQSTVSFGGQTARLQMAASLMGQLNSENVLASDLLTMFNDGSGFGDSTLDDSGKKLGNKTAAYGDESVVEDIRGFITEYADVVSTSFSTDAAAGIAGSHTGAGGRTVRINGKGMELNQVFAKSLIGALVMDQVAYGYLSATKIGDAVENEALEDGKNYTKMEHHFDEGFGYVYGQESDITAAASPDGSGVLFAKYLKKVNASEEAGIATEIYDAFKMARAAIVANDSEVRDAQAEVVKTKMSRVILHKAAYYLRAAAVAKTAEAIDYADYFHGLSEGYGFVLSLQFTYDQDGVSYFSHAEVDTMLTALEAGNGFWDITSEELNDMAAQIEAKL
mgnify:FL=1